jgi:phosphoribosylanthranilate isomerase
VPLILSGGLDADNVGAAVAATGPYAIDSASGTESRPGHKDLGRMAALFAAVQALAAQTPAEDASIGGSP